MQTFLPYPDFKKSLECLDNKRLGKQRVEAFQILNILCGYTKTKGWQNHPAVLMWRGYENALKQYYNLSIEIWKSRGFKNTMKPFPINEVIVFPKWFGNDEFHKSHQSNLVRKLPEYYKQFFPNVSDSLPYIWNKEIA